MHVLRFVVALLGATMLPLFAVRQIQNRLKRLPGTRVRPTFAERAPRMAYADRRQGTKA